ncbi:single-stranded DNA-binding protein [Mycolicibacterium peregrinum]|jgi:single-strand DNA-binding protein|uniref:Single-stranded DNA-binding protein n=1 Tax=Mycolicibacterium peregrinum TaxID=43304 RepID=A0A1A1ZMD8_MYCPR|nr:single-stranded DNA-binding protein [Mycolicibacterium peregrinum]OBB94308.1 single-stranded DNA-binding protein [Mycolicibacterium peregrinum]OBF44634.1 single-stranded DNA-binding protein [Mycolicibacterium peregrinum]
MFETPFTIVGNIITDPVRRRFGDQELYKFRVASNSRRRTPEGNWEHGNSLYVTVNCWGNLATGTSASLMKGDAVIVVGHVHTDEYEDKEGVRRSSVEVRATAVGPDLSRCTARVAPLPKPAAGPAPEPESVDSHDAETEPDEGELPLSA